MKRNLETEKPGICLFVMGEKGLSVVRNVAEKFPNLVKEVFGARDKNVAKDFFAEIKALCKNLDISFAEDKSPMVSPNDFVFAISWRWLIHHNPKKLVVFHDSILPRYRGFNPLVSCLINGEKKIGVTALFGEKEFDEGDIISQKTVSVNYPVKISKAIELIADLYVELALSISQKIADGKKIPSVKQCHEKATFSLWRDESDYQIDWQESAEEIKRFIDAVGFPYRGAKSTCNEGVMRIIDAQVCDDVRIENRTPGKVLFVHHGFPVVVCGKGLLRIERMERDEDGKSALPLKIFRSRFL